MGLSGGSWWIALKPGLSRSIAPPRRAPPRSGGRCRTSRSAAAVPTGRPPTRCSDRLAGSHASRWLSAVVPVRGRPVITIGAGDRRRRASSGCVRCQSVTRSRLARLPFTCPSNAAWPIRLRSAWLEHRATSCSKPVAERRVAEVVEAQFRSRTSSSSRSTVASGRVGHHVPPTAVGSIRSPSASTRARRARRGRPWSARGRTRRHPPPRRVRPLAAARRS